MIGSSRLRVRGTEGRRRPPINTHRAKIKVKLVYNELHGGRRMVIKAASQLHDEASKIKKEASDLDKLIDKTEKEYNDLRDDLKGKEQEVRKLLDKGRSEQQTADQLLARADAAKALAGEAAEKGKSHCVTHCWTPGYSTVTPGYGSLCDSLLGEYHEMMPQICVSAWFFGALCSSALKWIGVGAPLLPA
ncbi:hypothetical protein NQZ68_038607 [Dissostichus eleginoides]|nr:hypothetical protein NQZ68_038607 [Dissostichus eleginoides]